MKELTVLRLYFPQSARAKPTRFWHHLSAPALGQRLLMAARRSGIHQALIHTVHAGYLPGKQLTHQHIEGAHSHHPLCMELVDIEERLRKFLNDHADELRNVQAVLFRCELAL